MTNTNPEYKPWNPFSNDNAERLYYFAASFTKACGACSCFRCQCFYFWTSVIEEMISIITHSHLYLTKPHYQVVVVVMLPLVFPKPEARSRRRVSKRRSFHLPKHHNGISLIWHHGFPHNFDPNRMGERSRLGSPLPSSYLSAIGVSTQRILHAGLVALPHPCHYPWSHFTKHWTCPMLLWLRCSDGHGCYTIGYVIGAFQVVSHINHSDFVGYMLNNT